MDWNYQQSIKSACIILKNFLSSLRASVRLDFEYWLQVAVRLVQIVMKTRFSARLNHLTSFFSLRAIETNSSNSRKRQRRERIEREEMSLVGNIYLLPQKKKKEIGMIFLSFKLSRVMHLSLFLWSHWSHRLHLRGITPLCCCSAHFRSSSSQQHHTLARRIHQKYLSTDDVDCTLLRIPKPAKRKWKWIRNSFIARKRVALVVN